MPSKWFALLTPHIGAIKVNGANSSTFIHWSAFNLLYVMCAVHNYLLKWPSNSIKSHGIQHILNLCKYYVHINFKYYRPEIHCKCHKETIDGEDLLYEKFYKYSCQCCHGSGGGGILQNYIIT